MSWTSRNRVIAALEHREADRVPVDLNPGQDFYLKLKDYLHIEVDEQLKPTSMGEVIPHPDVLKALGVDLISVKLGSPRNARKIPERDGMFFDEWGIGWQRIYNASGGSYLEAVYHPLAEASLEDLESYPWPNPGDPGRYESLAEAARRLYEDTELAIVGRFGGPIIEVAIYLMGFENWLVRLATDPGFAGALLGKIAAIQTEMDRAGLEEAGKYLQIFKVSGDDLGMQTGLLYSPVAIRTHLMPHFIRRWQAARQILDRVNPSARLMFHCCGSIRPVISDFIAAGLQVLDPVQPRAAGMDPAGLKRDFGEALTFHGGVDEQSTLPFGSEEDVRREVQQRIAAFAPGGGYILTSSHFVQADTPPANVVAMCQAAREYRY